MGNRKWYSVLADPKFIMEFMDCGSGFPAANRLITGGANRGWKAAPTIKPTFKILKLTPIRAGGSPVQTRLDSRLRGNDE